MNIEEKITELKKASNNNALFSMFVLALLLILLAIFVGTYAKDFVGTYAKEIDDLEFSMLISQEQLEESKYIYITDANGATVYDPTTGKPARIEKDQLILSTIQKINEQEQKLNETRTALANLINALAQNQAN